MKRPLAAPLVLAGVLALGAGAAAPVSAQSVAQGKPYGCQINPNAPGCQSPTPSPSTSFSPPSVLPSTGGAQPSTPAGPLGAAVGAVALLIGGAALRRRARRD